MLLAAPIAGACAASAAEQTPMTLQEAIAAALRQSPQARSARYAREAAKSQADHQRPGIRPTLDVSASETLQGPEVTFPGPGGTEATFLQERYARLDLTLVQPIYKPGLEAAKEMYNARVGVAESDYRKGLVDVALAVNRAYLDVLHAENGIKLAQDGLDAALRYRALVQKQVSAGLGRPVDAQLVEAQVAEAQEGLSQALSALALARMAFNRAIGAPLEAPVTLVPVSRLPNVPESPDSAVVVALHNRPELTGLEQNLRVANAGISLAHTQSQPALDVRAEYSEQTPSALIHEHYYAALLEVRWSILDAGKSVLDEREARANHLRVEADLQSTREAIRLDVMQAWQRMREAQGRIGLSQKQIDGLKAALAVAERAYEVGRGTLTDVHDSQRELRAAQMRELQAEYDLHSANTEFIYAQGVGLADLKMFFPAPLPRKLESEMQKTHTGAPASGPRNEPAAEAKP
jgi:outer membrane protein TolC